MQQTSCAGMPGLKQRIMLWYSKHYRAMLYAGGIITDLVSYYTLPSSIMSNDKYDSLKAAFMYYTVATETALQDLMQDILIFARDRYGVVMFAQTRLQTDCSWAMPMRRALLLEQNPDLACVLCVSTYHSKL